MTKILHVVALSGGKDSTAMALRLKELYPDRDFTYVCTPTGNELPEMYQHWADLRERLGGRFIPIVVDTLAGVIKKQDAIPNWRWRFCTRILKIEPYAAWLMKQSDLYDQVFSYVGLRIDENEREGGDYTHVPGVEMVFPMRDWGWGIGDVVGYLERHGVTIPERTDCALCFYQRIEEWYRLWKNHPELYQEGVDIEKAMGHTFRSPGRDTWPADLEGLRAEFERGRPVRGMKEKNIGERCRVCTK